MMITTFQVGRNSLLDESSLRMYMKHLRTEYLKEMAVIEGRGGESAGQAEGKASSSFDRESEE